MMPPQTTCMGGNRSGGVSPVPSPLRSTYLGGGRPTLGVEGGDSPPSVRLTGRGEALAGFIAAFAFCLVMWLTFFMFGVIPMACGVIFGAVTFVVIANVTHEVSKQK